MKDYEQLALLLAEKFGIIEYNVIENYMHYTEKFTNEIYNAKINLDTGKEKRLLVNQLIKI